MLSNNSEKQETMKKTTLLFAGLIMIALVSFSFGTKTKSIGNSSALISKKGNFITAKATIKNSHAEAADTLSSLLAANLRLNEKGLSNDVLKTALRGYLHLLEQGDLQNEGLLSIVDFSQSSRRKRFYLIDMKKRELLVNTYVAHGKNSGVDMANSFSNTIGSEKSSLGFYVTKGTYTGKNGFSLKMAGLDKGYNDNAEARAVVVHGADYVNEGRVNSAYMGRSQGCPALPRADYIKVIGLIKDGSVLFIYSQNENYLNSSQLLNS